MQRFCYIFTAIMLAFLGCRHGSEPDGSDAGVELKVERYDRVEMQYLTTGDFSALQQMNTGYSVQTRMLIEDILRIGYVNDPDINAKFLNFYQDSTLQCILREVGSQYADMDDIDRELSDAFGRLKRILPDVDVPMIYTQIGSLDQSIVVSDDMLGISLDKYLGSGFPLYLKYYPVSQRAQMERSMIVPDCMMFYLLSLFPVPHEEQMAQAEHDVHIGKIQWVTNRVTGHDAFSGKYISMVDDYMRRNRHMTMAQLLSKDICHDIIAR